MIIIIIIIIIIMIIIIDVTNASFNSLPSVYLFPYLTGWSEG